MGNEFDPIVGQWYQHIDKGQLFQVISIDEDARTIETQHFDGDIDAIDLEAWPSMAIEQASEPEDWTGPVDDVEVDDMGYTETAMRAEDWNESLQTVHLHGSTEPTPDEFERTRHRPGEILRGEIEESESEWSRAKGPDEIVEEGEGE